MRDIPPRSAKQGLSRGGKDVTSGEWHVDRVKRMQRRCSAASSIFRELGGSRYSCIRMVVCRRNAEQKATMGGSTRGRRDDLLVFCLFVRCEMPICF